MSDHRERACAKCGSLLHHEDDCAERFFIPDARLRHTGHCAVWWRAEGEGYTANLDDAGEFTREAAQRICRSRASDLAVPCSVARDLVCAHVPLSAIDAALGEVYRKAARA